MSLPFGDAAEIANFGSAFLSDWEFPGFAKTSVLVFRHSYSEFDNPSRWQSISRILWEAGEPCKGQQVFQCQLDGRSN